MVLKETSVFGAEIVTMKQGIDALRGLRNMLRMMGIPMYSPSYIYEDNMSVVHNTSRPESVLRKKSNSECYHAVHESVAMGESLVGHIPSKQKSFMGKRGDIWLVLFFMIFMTTISYQFQLGHRYIENIMSFLVVIHCPSLVPNLLGYH